MIHTKNIALLLAGGQGVRMHEDTPKQFVTVCGKPLFIHALQAFEHHDDIDEIMVVCSNEWGAFVDEMAKKHRITKYRDRFPAGLESIDSLRNGIEGIRRRHPGEEVCVVTHEAVRPLIDAEIITENLNTYRRKGNAITSCTGNEAYLVSHDGCIARECLPREELFMAQMPQTFSLGHLEALFAEAERLNIKQAQSLFLFHACVFPDKPLHIAKGSITNIKVTLPEDLRIAEALLDEARINRKS